MSKRITLAVLFIIFQNISFATVFSPMPFDKQVEEASSGVEAKLASTKVFKNSSGMIMTEYSFDVLESYNFAVDDFDNQQLKLTMPGGTYDGVTSMIDGAPQFVQNEKSFLLLKKIESKIYLSNFTLGKFKIQNMEGHTFYVSEVFPSDPNIGKISKEKMINLMKTKWKISLMTPRLFPRSAVARDEDAQVDRDVHVIARGLAQERTVQSEGVPVFFWGAFVMFVFFFAIIFIKLGKNESHYKSE